MKEFEVTTKLMNSDRLWKLAESGLTKRMWEQMGYAEFGKVPFTDYYYEMSL